ncbi:hypothetical protein WME75_01225 [Sorangium sp. So ce1014]|uniref:hypothetical protein n=1 Tax=Sorangium sp. So ce1014 TaxID=3133326 RepID=UPI003F63DEC5
MTRRSPVPLVLALATLAAGAALAAGAHADEVREEAPSTLAVLCPPGDRFGLRIVAELESLGFRTEIVDPAAEPATRASLEASARRAGAIAAIRAVRAGRGVEVWIVAPFARLGVAFAVTPAFRLRADVLASVIAQGVSIQITEHDTVTWGQPILLTSAGVDFGWF